MSVLRQSNTFQGQARQDSPHFKALESSICADFDLLAGRMLSGLQALVVRGFEITQAGSAIGKAAVDLTLNTANSAIIHPLATASGSIFFVPSGAALFSFAPNDQLQGSFTANSVNYVGLDLRRNTSGQYAQDSVDTVKFLDVANTEEEIARQIPLGKFLDYVVVVTTQGFDFVPSVAPICKITTDSSNVVTAIEDCRYRPSRLATGGSFPDITSSYPWPQGREENTTGDVFYGGDKAINSYKEWQDAIMTRLWEIGGGKYWYSPAADRNVSLTREGSTFTNGEWFEWDGTNLHWRGLKFFFDNSGAGIFFNTISDQLVDAPGAYGTVATNLADGDCIFVDIVRSSNATISAIKGRLDTLGTPVTPGSRYIVAWRRGANIYSRGWPFLVGQTFTVATNTNLGVVQLTYAAGTPATPLVMPQDANGSMRNAATGGNGYGLQGTGNGSGVGLRGVTSATGGALQLEQSTSTTNVAPLATITSSGGNITNLFDRVGYMTGRYNRIHENWEIPVTTSLAASAVPISTYPRWSWTRPVVGATLTINPPQTAYPSNMLILATGGGGGQGYIYSSGFWPHTGFTGLRFVMEWEASSSANFSATRQALMGLSGFTGLVPDILTGTSEHVAFYGSGVGAGNKWHAITWNGGVATDTLCTTTFAANEILRFRIEVWGSATVFGAATAKFFINSTLEATHTTNMPSTAAFCTFYLNDSVGVGDLKVGPVSAYWNRYLNLPTL